jgi:hypothetical protein
MLGEYADTTADTRFLRDHWANIEGAYRLCSSMIDPAVFPGKEGNDEQGHPRSSYRAEITR